MKRLIWMLAGLLGALPALSQTPLRLTLPEAEAMAVKNNPEVSASLLNAAASNQVTLEVRSAFLPTVNGSVTGVGALANSSISAGFLTNSSVYSRLGMGVSAGQLITDFGRTSNLTASARLHAEGRADAAKATRAEIVLQTDRAYYSALRAQAVLKVAQQTVTERQTVADQVGALAKVNLKSGLDVSFANVNLSDAKLLLLSAQNDLRASFADLSNALGTREPQSYELVEPASSGEPPADAAPLIRTSLLARPDVLSARADYNSALRFTAAEADLRKPTISAVASTGVAPEHADQIKDRYAAAGVNVNVPVFNGHLFSARQSEAELRAQAQAQVVRSLENRVAHDVTTAVLNAATAYQRLALTAELVQQATLSLDLAQARYNLGLSSIVELSQAELNLTSAQIAGSSAKFDYELQRAVLDYQMGVVR
jgi:outer membrane protein